MKIPRFFLSKMFGSSKIRCTFASLSATTRALSSAGSEHLPYKQRVGGSNPSAPTKPSQSEGFLIIRHKKIVENLPRRKPFTIFAGINHTGY